MKKTKIYLLTGPVRSGKTTALQHWIQGKKNVQGLLSPDQGDGRSFQNIQSGERWNMEATKEQSSDLCIGRFRFRRAAFDKANEVLIQSLTSKSAWIIVDEVGPLELNNSGLRSSIDHLIRTHKSNNTQFSMIWVVRDSLLEMVQTEWDLDFVVMRINDLVSLNS